MPMTLKEAVEIGLAAKRVAARTGQVFEFDERRLVDAGMTNDGVRAVKMHIARIGALLDDEMNRLNGWTGLMRGPETGHSPCG